MRDYDRVRFGPIVSIFSIIPFLFSTDFHFEFLPQTRSVSSLSIQNFHPRTIFPQIIFLSILLHLKFPFVVYNSINKNLLHYTNFIYLKAIE